MSGTRIVTDLTDIHINEINVDEQEITVSFIWGTLKIERTRNFSRVTYSVAEWMSADDGVCTVDYGMSPSGNISISEKCHE